MNPGAGVVTQVCSWVLVLVLVQSLEARTPVSCRLKELTGLTRSLMDDSLRAFDEANGEHLGTWSPGFPELQVQENSPPHGSKVQCSLLFMTQGLEEVLEDQKNNLNPEDVSLHQKLRSTISRVELLSACVKDVLGGRCSSPPGPPAMPRHAFDRKQWSHTLLEAGRDYLAWLEQHVRGREAKVTEQNETERDAVVRLLEGSGFLL